MFLGLLDPDPSITGMDLDPAPDSDPPIIMKNSKKNLDSYCFKTPFDHLSLKNDVNLGYLQKVIGRKTFFKLVFCWHLEG